MLGYTKEDLTDMTYGIESAMLMINADEHPGISRYLDNALDFLNGLWAEGYFD
jgi:hypothetical protein